ncbi:voltage-gated chloride channel family protein [uncultured Bacteroides sp.]|uniref:voltage-gated chloride channel family protein n=1 Tax=uncultured Bacteroides sp. TaxID=162156 RepID=UPI002AA90856|nr:voltage-gated chloride channel family protein [uncultured Bacteroides sp.]
MKKKIGELITFKNQSLYFIYLIRWILISAVVSLIIGSASAFFLKSLEWATDWRESHLWIIGLLPIGGLIVGLTYYYWGNSVVKGNNLLLEEFHSPKQIISLRMAPLVLFGTIVTHLFGGSAGREGTAVQMGGAIADQFTRILKLRPRDRKIVLVMGVSAGFASVFGTPLAGAIFAVEVMILGRIRYEALLPSFFAAIFANIVCEAWGIHHTHYAIPATVEVTPLFILYAVLAGIFFGLVAMIFSRSVAFWGNLFKNKIAYPPLRPFIGGIFIAVAVLLMGTTKYIGLGIPTLVSSFTQNALPYDFILKLLFTTFTLGAGFKGGEVTPLFFVGATLGNALAFILPLPMALLAGMGFVAVFAGATNTPIACTLMGIELFGAGNAVYIGTACVVAYLFSGHTGIYTAQIVGSPKILNLVKEKGKELAEINIRKSA